MEFAFTPEQEALRAEVQEFIADYVTPEIIAELEDTGVRRRGPKTRELYGKIAERGWIGISWPREYGGQDGSRIDQYIVEEEFARIGITVGGAGSGAPAILAAGTEEQKREFLPGIIRGEISFALGFTEPQVGRPGGLAVPRGARRRRVCHQRAKDVHHRRSLRHAHLPDGAHGSRRAPAPGHQHFSHPYGHAGHHGAPAVDDTEQPAGALGYYLRRCPHQRNFL